MLVYVLRLVDDFYYVGQVTNSADVDARIAQHKAGDGAQWTKLHPVVEVH